MQGLIVRSMTAACLVSLMVVTGCADNRQAAQSSAEPPVTLRVAPLDRTGSGGSLRSLDLSANTGSLPVALPVYRVVPAGIKATDVKARARKLGINGSVSKAGKRFVVRGNSATLEVDQESGSFDYTTDAFQTQTTALTKMLTDAEYRRRAEEFLEHNDLMHENAEFRDVNRDNVVGIFESGAWVERPSIIEVRFSHKPLGGIRFDQGVGPKIVVQFGEDGKILGALSVWRNVTPAGRRTLLSAQQALKEIERGNAQVFDVYGEETGTVDEVTLSYLNDPAGYDQQVVLPAYVVRGKAGGNKRFTAITWAVPGSELTIDPSLADGGTAAPLSTGPKE